MMTYLLLTIIVILVSRELYNKYKKKKPYDTFIVILTGTCIFFTSAPGTDFEIFFSTVVCIPYIFYLADFLVISPLKKHYR